ncbi:hypothetical protein JOF56_009510 [Kibdelosporangium banguiense]|uniref:Uncharacterized protein n=1 Tax=Kibdelosporangium banguiense TaxID=1365924 RepID=A0ABS4TXJ4_9PSEU|nr:hypothetical protein [Kibdelosporangium banguiense]MBP2329125.1 hypothetical protein [Kibdelosporangium banguiense]
MYAITAADNTWAPRVIVCLGGVALAQPGAERAFRPRQELPQQYRHDTHIQERFARRTAGRFGGATGELLYLSTQDVHPHSAAV